MLQRALKESGMYANRSNNYVERKQKGENFCCWISRKEWIAGQINMIWEQKHYLLPWRIYSFTLFLFISDFESRVQYFFSLMPIIPLCSLKSIHPCSFSHHNNNAVAAELLTFPSSPIEAGRSLWSIMPLPHKREMLMGQTMISDYKWALGTAEEQKSWVWFW